MPATVPPAPPADAPEHVRARFWREHIMRLSRAQLGRLLAMSVSRIEDLERGFVRGAGRPIDPASMTRYRLACAALTMGANFNFLTLRLSPPDVVPLSMFFPDGTPWPLGR